MSLASGTRLGPYEIVGLLGSGGMGEVYRASDPRVGREVAIKTSRAEFSDRFEKEARAVAALNHPNICHLYDVGKNYLVMELVEGENLHGPMPVDEAMGVARQIAAALEAAHEKGIVHRDLKPANVKITPDGVVKVLDFGLARMVAPEPEVTNDSPTIQNVPMGSPTMIGTILGTAAYMSPEQARGKVADKRADIWAFGVVLYEVLTGRRLFEGETVSDVLAGVLKQEPDLSAVPVKLRRLIAKCLEKDPKKRLRDIGDWAELIEEERAAASVVVERKRPVAWIAVGGVAVLALAGLGAIHFREPRAGAGQAMHLSVAIPESISLVGFMALSPDGRTLAVSGTTPGGKSALSLRALGSDQFRPLPGTELARDPFWSADGRNLAFSVNGKLKFVAANGGPAQELCDGVGFVLGGTWNRDNVILISGRNTQILKTNASGGGCSPLPRDPAVAQRYPWFLPDGKHFLYLGAPLVPDSAAASRTGVYVASLEDPAKGKRLLPDYTSAIFAPGDTGGDGYLLFRRDGALVGQAFDPGTLQLSGEVFKITDAVALHQNSQMMASAAPNGVLVYGTGRNKGTQLTWLDRAGKALSSPGPVLDQSGVALSPGNRQIAASRTEQTEEIWLRDVASNSESRFTSQPVGGVAPVWSPDGKLLAYSGNDRNLYLKAVSGGSKEELLLKNGNQKYFSDWSRDGRFLLYTEVDVKTQGDIWVLPNPAGKAGDSKPYAFQQTEANESQAQLSPDGRWVAYTSNESGAEEVHVRPFPSGEGRWKVSVKGGREPRWRGDGKELFYTEPALPRMHFMTVPVKGGASGAFESGTPVQLFEHPANSSVIWLNFFTYAVSADGQRFLVLSKPDLQESIHVLTNWMLELPGRK